MKQTVSRNEFIDAFRAYDRMDNFSIQGLDALFEYFEQWEAETGEEIELDVIAICCDFSEDATESIAKSYDIDLEDMDDEEKKEAVEEYLHGMGVFVGQVSGGFVYRDH